jgi:anti-sigma B factor antagonist
MHSGSMTAQRRVELAIAPSLKARVAFNGAVLTVRLRGELDVATADRFCDVLLDLMTEQGAPHLIVDAADLGFCDPYGLSALVRAANYTERSAGSITLTGARPLLTRLLRVTGLERRFPTG